MYRHADDVDIGPLGFPIALHGMGDLGWDVRSIISKINPLATTDAMVDTAAPRATPAAAVPTKTDPVAKSKVPANTFDAVKYSPNTFIAAIWSRVGDLQSFGAIDLPTMYKVNDLLLQNRTSEANAIVKKLEDKLAGNQSNPIVDKINDALPDGFKLSESMIGGVPNFVVYAGAGLFGALILRSALKKR